MSDGSILPQQVSDAVSLYEQTNILLLLQFLSEKLQEFLLSVKLSEINLINYFAIN